MRFILEREEYLTEGLFNWASKLLKKGKIKKALNTYTNDYPEAKKQTMLKQFEIQIAKKSSENSENPDDSNVELLQQELESLKEEEQLIKDQLDTVIEEVIKKKPEMKLTAKKLQLEAKKKVGVLVRDMLQSLAKGGKYKEFNDVIKDRIKAVTDQQQKIESGLSQLDEAQKKKQKGEEESESSSKDFKDLSDDEKKESLSKLENDTEIQYNREEEGKTGSGKFQGINGDDVKIKTDKSEFTKKVKDIISISGSNENEKE